MPAVRAIARNVGASPKKIRPIADLIRGKRVEDALNTLRFLTSPWAKTISKVVKSATSNAESNLMMDAENLKVVSITVDQGPVLKRLMPHARGRTGRIRKPSSHITVVVNEEVS